MEIYNSIKIKKFILFVNGVGGSGMGDMVFSSDSVGEIYGWMDRHMEAGKTAFILDTYRSEITKISGREPDAFANYIPDAVRVGAAVWIVDEGLPGGTVVNVDGDTVTVDCDGEEISTTRSQCVFSIGDSASELER